MRQLAALLDRDWRDHRAIVAVMAASILGLSMLFRSMAPDAGYWHSAALAAVPAIWAIFVVGLACDVVGCEFTPRRIETLALLPASLLKLWTSKAAFLALMLVAFLVWTLGCQFATVLAFDDATPDFERFLREVPAMASLAMPMTVIALFVATLVERTLPALFLTMIVAVSVFGGAEWFLAWFAADKSHEVWVVVTTSQVIAVVFAFTAARTFVAGRIHTTVLWRKWAVATSTLGALLIVLVGVSGWRIWSWKQLSPGDDDAVVETISASPDGRWLAVHAMRYADGDFRTGRVWTISIDGSGTVVEANGSNWITGWDADGSLKTTGQDGKRALRQTVDPATGAVRSAVAYDPFAENHFHDGTYYPYWAGPNPMPLVQQSGKFARTVTWKARDITRRIETIGVLAICRLPGIVWYSPDGRRVVRLDFATGEERALYESPTPITRCYASTNGARLMLHSDRRTRLLDAATGALLAGPWESFQVFWANGSSDDGRFVRVTLDGHDTVIDSQTGRTVELAKTERLGRFGYVHTKALADGRLVLLDKNGRIDLYDAAGSFVRHLYTPKGN